MDKREEVKNTLKDSLKGIFGDDLPIENGDLLPSLSEGDDGYIPPYDSSGNLQKAQTKATKVITSMLKLFMSNELINKSEFLQAKTNLDVMSITQILVSLKQIEYSIDIILRDIGFGQAQPRLFEVFGQLQKTKVELIREYNLMINSFEESMKRYKNDLEFLEGTKSNKIHNVSSDKVHRGTRNLMRELQEEINSEKGDKIEYKESEDEISEDVFDAFVEEDDEE